VKSDYAAFLAGKAPRAQAAGFEPGPMHEALRPDQRDVTGFCLRQGRAAIFGDTGVGKSVMELEWCDQAGRASNGYSLLFTPLAVAKQFEREAVKFGYDARVIRSQKDIGPGINICNYDLMKNINTDCFGAVALDESGILQSLQGKTRLELTRRFAETPYRLCATATPAPNDHMELGTHAEFLGIMSSQEMLSRWFINDTKTASQNWRLKKAAVTDFWDWVASWARCYETPADLGYDVPGFVLPELKIIKHSAMGDIRPPAGSLFLEDVSAIRIHEIKRQTSDTRAREVALLIASEPDEQWLIWVDTDYDADALRRLIPSIPELRGSMKPEKKEAVLEAFLDGGHLITKPKMTSMGVNWQHIARVVYMGRSFSYRDFYQSVRRAWRYGQKRPVEVHLIVAEGEDQIGRVIDAKAGRHKEMKSAMKAAMLREIKSHSGPRVKYDPQFKGKFPSWLKSNPARMLSA
jgi:hypothetical protein